MEQISFKQFIKDFAKYYDIKKGDYIKIVSEEDLNETIEEIYDTTSYEVDYENNVIEIY